MVAPLVNRHREEIAELCRRYHVRRLDVFGSAARGDFDVEHSDVDFLVVEADWSANESAWAFLDFRDELRRIIGRDVDLIDESGIRSRYAKQEIDASRERFIGEA